MSVRQKVRRRSVLTAKCPHGELSVRRTVRAAKCPYGEMSYGEMSYGEKSYGEKSGHEKNGKEISSPIVHLLRVPRQKQTTVSDEMVLHATAHIGKK